MASVAPPAVLIVDSDHSSRRFMRETLVRAGYVTVEARSAEHAQAVVLTYPGTLKLVILEIVMPNGGGLDFANHLAMVLPSAKILYVSAFVDSVAVASIIAQAPQAILAKPISARQLLARVRQLIGEPAAD